MSLEERKQANGRLHEVAVIMVVISNCLLPNNMTKIRIFTELLSNFLHNLGTVPF